MNNIAVKSLIQSSYPTLHQTEKKVADYILSHAHEVINCSVTKLSERNHANEATIVRTCKKLDYQGHYHLKIILAKEVINPDGNYPDDTDFTDITSLATFLLKERAKDLIQSTQFFNAEMFESIPKLLANCDTIFFFTAENSNPLAIYGTYKLNQFGLKVAVHVSPEVQINTAYPMGKRDLATGISSSGDINLMVDISKVVKERGARSVCIANYIKSPLSRLSAHQLNTAASDKIFFEASDSTRVPTMGVIDMLVLLFMYKNKAHYEKYHTHEKFLGSRFKG